MTFVPLELLRAWAGGVDATHALARVSSDLGLDFAFVGESSGGLEALDRTAQTGTRAMWVVEGPLGGALASLGWSEGLRATVSDPDSLALLMDDALEIALAAVMMGVERGCSAVVLAEDIAGSEGPLVPPDFAYAEVFPRLARVVEASGEAGVPAVLHTDGDPRAFLEATRRAGFVGVHTGGGLGWDGFERVFGAAREHELIAIGGLCTEDLQSGTMHAVVAGTRAGELAQRGGLLVSDDGGITHPEEFAALAAAIAAVRDSG